MKENISQLCKHMNNTEVIPKRQQKSILDTQIKIQGYEEFINFERDALNFGESGIRGVAIYVRDDIKCTEVKLNTNYDDHVWVDIKLTDNNGLLCGCIYRSPTKEDSQTEKSTAKVCDIIREVMQRKPYLHILICGDFNYPSIDWENEYVHESKVRPFLETIQEVYLHQHIAQPTRYRIGQEPSRLDLILSGEEGLVQNVKHNPGLGESDHECIRFSLNCKEERIKPGSTKNYYKADYKVIRERLKKVNWEDELKDSLTTSYKKFCKIMEKCMEGCIPEYQMRSKSKNIYFTNDAIRLKNTKNKLWRRYTRMRTSYNHTRYKSVRNQLRRFTRKLRVDFEKDVTKNI